MTDILTWVREHLNYQPETGVFTWIKTPANAVKVGQRAGGISGSGYRYIWIRGRAYSEHRLAWLFVYGRWPENHVDHINGVLDDNRLCNLRDATRSQNQANRAATRKSKSGFKGVHSHGRKWVASIQRDKQPTYLGTFDTAELAHAAYAVAAKELFGDFARTE